MSILRASASGSPTTLSWLPRTDDTNTAAASGSDASALSRSTTIKERLNYLTIGMGMFRHSPVFGGGAGVVEADYGLYKPIDARETKTLHNWPVQWLAETGLVGTGIYLIFRCGGGLLAMKAYLPSSLTRISVGRSQPFRSL